MVKDFKSNTDAKRLHEAILAEAIREMPRLSQGDERVPLDRLTTVHGMINANSSGQPAGLALSKPEAFIRLPENLDQSSAQRNSTLFLSGTGVLLILLGIRLS